MSSDNAQCAVTYMSISSDSDGPSWGIPLMNADELPEMDPYKKVAQQGQVPPFLPAYVPDPMKLDAHVPVYVPEPEKLKYHALSNDDIQVEDQPHADDASPTAESPGYIAPFGHRTAMIRRRDDTPEEDMPPRRRFVFIAPSPRCDVAVSFAAAAVRAPKEDVGALHAFEHRMMTSIEEANLRISYQAQVRMKESKYFYIQLHDAQTHRRDIRLKIDVVRGQRTANETELQEEDVSQSLGGGLRRRVQPARLEKMESVFHISGCAIDNQVKFATCTMLGAALTWSNGHVRTLGHDVAYAMTWGTLKKKLMDKYCPKGKIKKLEIELWNLRVNGNDVAAYTQRFQELALMCTKFLADET
nr:reverse transcriptase domain-containing protein [Tanacetum cinerariifolium]